MRTLEKRQDIAMGNQQPSSCEKGLTGEGSETRQAVLSLDFPCSLLYTLTISSNNTPVLSTGSDRSGACGQDSLIVVGSVEQHPNPTMVLVSAVPAIRSSMQGVTLRKSGLESVSGMKNTEMILSSKTVFMRTRMVMLRPSLRNTRGGVQSVEVLKISKFIIEILVGQTFQKQIETTTSTTWYSYAADVMEGSMVELKDGLGNMADVFLVGLPTEDTRPAASVVTVRLGSGIGRIRKPNDSKGIVRPSMKVEDQDVDEVWAVDLPSLAEREQIFQIHIKKKGRDPADYDCGQLAEATDGWVGAEIEAVIGDAMFSAFTDRCREFTTEDVLLCISQTIPSSSRDREELERMRTWANTRARPVSAPVMPVLTPKTRKIAQKGISR